jgi:hypothetical protein
MEPLPDVMVSIGTTPMRANNNCRGAKMELGAFSMSLAVRDVTG